MSNRIAIVGASRSLGAALALALAHSGHRVVTADQLVLERRRDDVYPGVNVATWVLPDRSAPPWYRQFDAKGRKRRY